MDTEGDEALFVDRDCEGLRRIGDVGGWLAVDDDHCRLHSRKFDDLQPFIEDLPALLDCQPQLLQRDPAIDPPDLQRLYQRYPVCSSTQTGVTSPKTS